jgi:hypothetical protein
MSGPSSVPGSGAASGQSSGAAASASGQAPAGTARIDPTVTPGWSMMTPQEQQRYSDQMSSITTAAQCKAYQDAYMAQMQVRARSMGQLLEGQGADPCAVLQKQGTPRQ